MNKLKIKKVNVLKVAFFVATTYGIFGIAIQGESMGLVLMIIMPFLYAIGGFIIGLIMGGMYNLVSKWIGGIEVEVEENEKFSE